MGYSPQGRKKSDTTEQLHSTSLIHDVIKISYKVFMTSLIAQLVRNLPAMQETLVQFLGQEDPLEKG